MTEATENNGHIVAREITIVDDNGNTRIRLRARTDGPAELGPSGHRLEDPWPD